MNSMMLAGISATDPVQDSDNLISIGHQNRKKGMPCVDSRLFLRTALALCLIDASVLVTDAKAKTIVASGCSQQEAIDAAAGGDTVPSISRGHQLRFTTGRNDTDRPILAACQRTDRWTIYPARADHTVPS